MPELLDELSIARSGGELKKCLASYKKVYLLILDEWLIRTLSPQESYDLLEIVEARCQRPMIFCTQYQTEGWYTRIDPNPDSGSSRYFTVTTGSIGDRPYFRLYKWGVSSYTNDKSRADSSFRRK